MSLEPIATKYTIIPFPQDDRNGHLWVVNIRRQRDTTWIVSNSGFYLDRDGDWTPDRRAALHFVDLDDAVAHAQQAVKELQPGAHTYADMAEKWGTP